MLDIVWNISKYTVHSLPGYSRRQRRCGCCCCSHRRRAMAPPLLRRAREQG